MEGGRNIDESLKNSCFQVLTKTNLYELSGLSLSYTKKMTNETFFTLIIK